MERFATPEMNTMWLELTSYYRDALKAASLVELSGQPNIQHQTAFGECDMAKLTQASFVLNTGQDVQSYTRIHGAVGFVKLFAVEEEKPEGHRRRVISWPEETNEAERKIKDQLEARLGKVMFYNATQVRDTSATYKYAASLDLKKFFQQFELLSKQIFVVVHKGTVYELNTVPTGAVFPPLFAQLLTTTILKASIEVASPSQHVEFDACIDNLRIASDHEESINKVWSSLLGLLNSIGITIGEINHPSTGAYTYLGMDVSASPARAVSVSAKSRTKALRAANNLEDWMVWQDMMALFGVTVWMTTVTGSTIGHIYHVVKYMRRRARMRPEEDDTVQVWKCIIPVWKAFIEKLAILSYTKPPTAQLTATVYSDASDTGWGVVITNFKGQPLRTFGGRWTAVEARLRIEVREFIALRIAMRILIKLAEGATVDADVWVDNTTALAWARRRRAPTYAANQLAVSLQQETASGGINIKSLAYIRSADNPADAPSRADQPPVRP